MTEDLFTAYHSHLPQHVQDDFEEDEVIMLRRDRTLEGLINDGTNFSFDDFHSFVKKRVIFITPTTAMSASLDTPSHHPYTIDAIVSFPVTTSERNLHISGTNADATSPALSFLLRLLSISETKCGVIFKSFPMTPRQKLASIDLSPLTTSLGQKRKIDSLTQSSCFIEIEFRFLALNRGHCKLLFHEYNNLFASVKLSQCSVEEWKVHDDQESLNETPSNKTTASQKLTLSCPQHEFRKFAEENIMNSKETSISELCLLLHFMLADSDVQHLRSILETIEGLHSLTLEFLDIDDKTWSMVCESLRKNQTLQHIELAYTEKFADSYRRLTPERRRTRTNDIVELLQTNKTLQSFSWPKFQQDESLMPEIERLLMDNKTNASSS